MTVLKACAAALIAVAAADVAAAQSPQTPAPPPEAAPPADGAIREFEAERRYLDAEGFRAAFEGRTVHLTLNGAYFASEQYMPGARALWRPNGGECQPGLWEYSAPTFCFYYGYGRIEDNCWFVYESGGAFFAESTEGMRLKIASVTDEPLSCTPDLLS